MRSRAAKLTFSALGWIVIAAAAVFILQSEKQIAQRRGQSRAFDQHAREAAVALADVRAAEQAYVAAGQGVMFWMPKVAALIDTASQTVDRLIATTPSQTARQSLTDARAAIAAFEEVDRRARDYLKAGQQLMAGDVVFTEGGETSSQAARQVEAARLADRQAVDASEAVQRRQQAYALAGTGAVSALIAVLLAFVPSERRADRAEGGTASTAIGNSESDLTLRDFHAPATRESKRSPDRAAVPALRIAAELCTELGRVNDIDELKKLLARAAEALDAGGLIIWVGDAAGGDLRPVLAHGYSSQALARMRSVARSADNAAAKAYRTGVLQIVLARPGASNGAVVAPLLCQDGCIGALAAEINDRGETSDTVQSLAAIFASQLANVLAPSVAAAADSSPGQVAI